jgi:hypothetical protein
MYTPGLRQRYLNVVERNVVAVYDPSQYNEVMESEEAACHIEGSA